MHYDLIDNNDDLRSFINSLKNDPFVCVDSEFMRTKTYYPDLCLIQIGGRLKTAIIDMMAQGLDHTLLYDLFLNQKIVKVFHASRQDIEILYQMIKNVPAPVFDTQIAAMFCGFGDQCSYESLVNEICNKTIDKSNRYSDWKNRPLSKKQL
ncbi:MAG: ribonuclease D, partial [Pseudomonadota bacterium]